MRLHKRHVWWLLAPALILMGVVFQAFLLARQQSAVEEIERLGGRVLLISGEPAWLNRLTGGRSRRLFARATVVNLSETEITDSELTALERLNGLERLNLSDTRITDNGLRHLKDLTRLKALDLSGTRISGQGLVHLRSLAALEYLYLGGTQVGDGDLRHLKDLTRLQHLDVTGTAISGKGVEEIQRHLPRAEVKQ